MHPRRTWALMDHSAMAYLRGCILARRFRRLVTWVVIAASSTPEGVIHGRAQDGGQDSRSGRDGRVTTMLKVEPSRLRSSLERLVGFPTRHTLSPQNVAVAHWLRDEFRGMGYGDVTLHDFRIKDSTRHNVVCSKTGTEKPERVLILCAHYDSRTTDLLDARSSAPGADDNASGVAVLLEAARVLRDLETGWTIRFVAVSGEEQGLVGSSAYAHDARGEDADWIIHQPGYGRASF